MSEESVNNQDRDRTQTMPVESESADTGVVAGTPEADGIMGDLTGVRGDLTGVYGNLNGVRGDLTGIIGHLTGVRGNLDDCALTEDDRKRGVDISELLRDN